MSENKYNCPGLDNYQIDAWINTLGSAPVEVIKSADYGESYTMNCAHVLKLENKKYALVTESGCSCYSSEDADIDLFPNKKLALESFTKWEKEQSDYKKEKDSWYE